MLSHNRPLKRTTTNHSDALRWYAQTTKLKGNTKYNIKVTSPLFQVQTYWFAIPNLYPSLFYVKKYGLLPVKSKRKQCRHPPFPVRPVPAVLPTPTWRGLLLPRQWTWRLPESAHQNWGSCRQPETWEGEVR